MIFFVFYTLTSYVTAYRVIQLGGEVCFTLGGIWKIGKDMRDGFVGVAKGLEA